MNATNFIKTFEYFQITVVVTRRGDATEIIATKKFVETNDHCKNSARTEAVGVPLVDHGMNQSNDVKNPHKKVHLTSSFKRYIFEE